MNLGNSTFTAHLQKRNSHEELSTDSTTSRIFYSAFIIYDISFGRLVNWHLSHESSFGNGKCPQPTHNQGIFNVFKTPLKFCFCQPVQTIFRQV
jgi:hypothetical protein